MLSAKLGCCSSFLLLFLVPNHSGSLPQHTSNSRCRDGEKGDSGSERRYAPPARASP